MYKIFFIFYLNTKSKILLVRRTQYITSIGLIYKDWGRLWKKSAPELMGAELLKMFVLIVSQK